MRFAAAAFEVGSFGVLALNEGFSGMFGSEGGHQDSILGLYLAGVVGRPFFEVVAQVSGAASGTSEAPALEGSPPSRITVLCIAASRRTKAWA